jgi:hypothetical protein
MAVTHRTATRALVAVVLCLALLVGPVARADDGSGRTSPSMYVVIPLLATATLVLVVALVQAARAPARDVRKPDAALSALDRSLAAARGGEAGNSTRWKTPPKLAPARAKLAAVREPAVRK